MSCVLARFNEDAQRQLKSCSHRQHVDAGQAQYGGGGWVPERLICSRGFSPRVTRSNSAKGAPSPKSGNDRVADPVEESKASPPVPAEGASPVRGKDADVEALLLSKNKEIVVLREKLANHAADKQGPKITVSTDDANVPPESEDYWIDADGKKEMRTTNKILVKHKPKPKDKPKADSTTGLKWKGYCLEGCGCAACVAKREDPSKTEMLDPSKRVSKKPSPL